MTCEQHYGDCPPNNEASHEAFMRWKDRKAVWIKATLEERERVVKIAEDLAGRYAIFSVGYFVEAIRKEKMP